MARRTCRVALRGPAVEEFNARQWRGLAPVGARLAAQLYAVDVNPARPDELELIIVGGQGFESDDPDAIVRRALELVNEGADGLASKADELRVEVSYG